MDFDDDDSLEDLLRDTSAPARTVTSPAPRPSVGLPVFFYDSRVRLTKGMASISRKRRLGT